MDASLFPPPPCDSLRSVRDLLAPLLPLLQRELDHAQAEHGPACGLLVMTGTRPDDLLLYALENDDGAHHAAYPLYGLRAVALHYAREAVSTLWQSPPPDAVWCLVLDAERATVVSLQGARIRGAEC